MNERKTTPWLGAGLPMALLVAGLLLAFRKPLLGMVDIWSVSPMYSHAFVVPFISLGLVWTRREAFLRVAPRGARLAAVPAILVVLAALSIGEAAGIQIVQQLAFVAAIAAIVLFLFGFGYLRLSAPAIGYLLFMIPFWEALTERLHQPFQDNSASLGVALMRAVGVPAYREGTVIALPNIVIEVARACSGVNYLVAVLALALPLSIIRLSSWRRRLTLLVTAVVISALANGVRVGLIGWLAYLDVGSALHGPFHVLHGLFVAGVGYAVLFTGLMWMERREPPPPPRPAAPGGLQSFRWPDARSTLGLALVFWALVVTGVAPTSSPVLLADAGSGLLPPTLGDWHADALSSDAGAPTTDAWGNADVHVRRLYRQGDSTSTIDVWYYAQQTQQREVVNFKVAELHRRATRRSLPVPGGGRLEVNALIWPGRPDVSLFWYEVAGQPVSGELDAKLRALWNLLRSGRSHAAAVMISAPAADRSPEAQARAFATLDDLGGSIHARLVEHLSERARTQP